MEIGELFNEAIIKINNAKLFDVTKKYLDILESNPEQIENYTNERII